jgi:hypothetical protein
LIATIDVSAMLFSMPRDAAMPPPAVRCSALLSAATTPSADADAMLTICLMPTPRYPFIHIADVHERPIPAACRRYVTPFSYLSVLSIDIELLY